MITFQSERWGGILPELRPLLQGQWEELGLYRDRVPLDMDWEKYERFDALEILKVTTARDAGRLVGWYVSIVTPHPHYRTTLYGFLDFYYMLAPYRTGTLGLQLFMAMEQSMKLLGVQALIAISKTVRPIDLLFERLDWTEQGRTYMKVLA